MTKRFFRLVVKIKGRFLENAIWALYCEDTSILHLHATGRWCVLRTFNDKIVYWKQQGLIQERVKKKSVVLCLTCLGLLRGNKKPRKLVVSPNMQETNL